MKKSRKKLVAFHKPSMSSYRVISFVGRDKIKILIDGEKVIVFSKPFELILS